jgi:hypothetical protein
LTKDKNFIIFNIILIQINMKKATLILSVVALASCGQSKKDEASGKKVVCDSVKESTYDANGNEISTMIYKCDTVPESK